MLEFLHSSLKKFFKKITPYFWVFVLTASVCFFRVGGAAWLEQPSPVKPRQRRGERKERTAVLRRDKGDAVEVMRTMSS